MKNKVISIIIASLLLSCGSLKKEKSNLISEFLQKESSKLNFNEYLNDTIIITKEKASRKRVYYYVNWYKEGDKRIWKVGENTVIVSLYANWVDKKYTFVLNDEEKKRIKKVTEIKEKDTLWSMEEIEFPKKIITSENTIFGNNGKYTEQNCKKLYSVYLISNPIFLRNNTLALFYISITSNSGLHSDSTYQRLIIMKKQKGKWGQIGEARGIKG
jgi:hypothetical protein